MALASEAFDLCIRRDRTPRSNPEIEPRDRTQRSNPEIEPAIELLRTPSVSSGQAAARPASVLFLVGENKFSGKIVFLDKIKKEFIVFSLDVRGRTLIRAIRSGARRTCTYANTFR